MGTTVTETNHVNVINEVTIAPQVMLQWFDAQAEIASTLRKRSPSINKHIHFADEKAFPRPSGDLVFITELSGRRAEMTVPPGLWCYNCDIPSPNSAYESDAPITLGRA